jgi:hypothetical protein
MKRKVPLKRSPFKAKLPERKQREEEPALDQMDVCSVEGCGARRHCRGFCAKHYGRVKIHGSPELRGRRVVPDDERFRLSYAISPSGCHEWQRCRREGYGRFWVGGKLLSAHVYAWEIASGQPVPSDKQVNHKCHNRSCVNPAHLYLGTQRENMADMKAAGREFHPRGEDHPGTKLSTMQALSILESSDTTAALARKFGVSESLVRGIRKGTIRKSLVRPKNPPIRDEGYRRWTATLACIRCGVHGFSQAAHPNQGRGLGQKAGDDLCFPLCCTRPGILGCHAEHDQLIGMTLEERRQRELDYIAAIRLMRDLLDPFK